MSNPDCSYWTGGSRQKMWKWNEIADWRGELGNSLEEWMKDASHGLNWGSELKKQIADLKEKQSLPSKCINIRKSVRESLDHGITAFPASFALRKVRMVVRSLPLDSLRQTKAWRKKKRLSMNVYSHGTNTPDKRNSFSEDQVTQ